MYGTTGRRYIDRIRSLAQQYAARHILDYGCGKQDVWKSLHDEFDVRNYDPAIPGHDARPEPADLVVCIDVLEHVEPGCVEDVLADLARVTRKIGFFTIASQPSSKLLTDGSNSHRLCKPAEWWRTGLGMHFQVESMNIVNTGLEIMVSVAGATGVEPV